MTTDERIACPDCGSTESHWCQEGTDRLILECLSCHHEWEHLINREQDMVLVEGLWVPAGDMQLIEGLQNPVKKYKRPVIDGRVAWRYDRIKAVLEFLPNHRRRVAIDIGAHVGLWTRWLARDFERTIAFEPIIRHVDCLVKNLISDYGRVEIHPMALGKANEVSGLSAMVGEIEVSGRSHVGVPGVGEIITEISPIGPLDEFGFINVDLIKIDVEGYENTVLLGAKETIKINQPVIVIEQLGHEARYGEKRDLALDTLRGWGMVELRDNMKGDFYMGWK